MSLCVVRQSFNTVMTGSDFTPALPATPCDYNGNPLEDGSPPVPQEDSDGTPSDDDWAPFGSRERFEWADFIFRRSKMSKGNTDYMLQLLAATLRLQGDDEAVVFKSSRDLYETIDATKAGAVPWQSCRIRPRGDVHDDSPIWMTEEHEIWFRDPHEVVKQMLANPDFDGHFDYMPYKEYGPEDHTASGRRWKDFMSGDWAWEQAVSEAFHHPNQSS